MQITIDIPDSVTAAAAEHGMSPETYAMQVLIASVRRKTADSPRKKMDLDEFIQGMAQFSDKIPVLPDSALTREAIYDDHD